MEDRVVLVVTSTGAQGQAVVAWRPRAGHHCLSMLGWVSKVCRFITERGRGRGRGPECINACMCLAVCAVCSQGTVQSPVHLVVGNESGDVDSTACALSYAFLLSQV